MERKIWPAMLSGFSGKHYRWTITFTWTISILIPICFLSLLTRHLLLWHCQTSKERLSKSIVISKADERRLQRGHYQFRVHGLLIAMSWFDRHGVSTIHLPRNPACSIPTVTRKNGRQQVNVPSPLPKFHIKSTRAGLIFLFNWSKTFQLRENQGRHGKSSLVMDLRFAFLILHHYDKGKFPVKSGVYWLLPWCGLGAHWTEIILPKVWMTSFSPTLWNRRGEAQ